MNPLVDALLGPRARADDPEGAAIVAGAFRRASRRGMYAAIRWLSLARPDLTAGAAVSVRLLITRADHVG